MPKQNLQKRKWSIYSAEAPCLVTKYSRVENSPKEDGQASKLKTSSTRPQTSLARWHLNNRWSIVSNSPHKQQWLSPFQPLFTREVATCSLLLKTCHKKNLIFKGILLFHFIFCSYYVHLLQPPTTLIFNLNWIFIPADRTPWFERKMDCILLLLQREYVDSTKGSKLINLCS